VPRDQFDTILMWVCGPPIPIKFDFRSQERPVLRNCPVSPLRAVLSGALREKPRRGHPRRGFLFANRHRAGHALRKAETDGSRITRGAAEHGLEKSKKEMLTDGLKAKGNVGKPAHSRYALDAEEDARLRRLAKDGRGAAVIAERLKRSQGAVYNRARKLGVTLKRAAAEGKGEMK
jgi:hypothetical protein